MRKWMWTAMVGGLAVFAAYVWVSGVSILYFKRAEVANGYPTVCLQKSSAVPDEDDSRYSCTQSSGLHVWAGQEVYAFLHDGPEGDFVLVCTDDQRRSVQHFGYYTSGSRTTVEKMTLTCGG